MSSEAVAPRLIASLEEITHWREGAEKEARQQLEEVDVEEARLKKAIEDLQTQIVGLDTLRGEVRARVDELDDQEIAKSYQAVVDSLDADSELLDGRSALVAERRAELRDKAEKLLADPELASAIDEFERFREMETGLSSLPASYRKAILDHHQAVKRRLTLVFETLEGAPEPLDAPTAGIAIVASVDPSEGPPESLVMVLPVDAGLYDNWADAGESVSATLAYRMVAAAATLAERAGVPGAPIAYRSFEGKLTIQVWFGDSDPEGDLKELAAGILDEVRFSATELSTAATELYTLWLPPDVLNPPEEEDDDESESSAEPDAAAVFEEELFGTEED
ncbi:MAG: hypothetical protein GY913_23475 [Proteobacteria bacterium]|nr:hypothetical protein [Pseudomonadota bacterium]